ncbi:hypothetical protein EST38_g6114 [Candolleomyces aberdarensis]|uniref:Uncharacterized protein n=1 Tax=Candolleomyces aberdarensis TaxID=2316362 RepID=A0A4Q2DKS2_9AGAR|nr:hypothetical protein EST38_g6114 [Candolleomyces aberdarensis]
MSKATSTRKRNSTQLSERDLPPPRRTKGIRDDVSLPLENTSLRRLIYILVALTTLLGLFYTYRTVQYKKEVGGWWNLLLGRKPPHVAEGTWKSGSSGGGNKHDVEDKINDLAAALGLPSHELASAIALAVHNYVPPASLSSIAAKETGSVVDVLVEGAESGQAEGLNVPQKSPEPTPGVVGEIVNGFETFVGLEEP